MWLFFALLSALFWALVHVLDSHCVGSIFEKPWMGVTTSAVASLIVLIVAPFSLLIVPISLPNNMVILAAVIAGCLIQISQGFYFQALHNTEAGIVAAYWNFTPVMMLFLSYLLFGTILNEYQYLGILILIFASVLFCLIDINLHTRWQSLYLMICASILQSVALLLENYAFKQAHEYYVVFLLITVGIAVTGSIPLMFHNVRIIFARNIWRLHRAIRFFIGIEIINLIALAASQKAIQIGIPALVAAVESVIPAFTFILSLIFLFLIPRLGDPDTSHKLYLKFPLIGLTVLGLWLVY